MQEQIQDYQVLLRILWVAYTLSIPLFVAVLFLMMGLGEGANWAAVSTQVSLGAGALVVVAALLYQRRTFSASRLRELLAPEADIDEMSKDSEYGVVNEDRKADLALLSPGELRVLAALQGLQVPFLLSLGINEVVALVGFVVAYVIRDFTLVVPFASAALILNVVAAPRATHWAKRLSRLTDTASA
jgi:hypothetical protein